MAQKSENDQIFFLTKGENWEETGNGLIPQLGGIGMGFFPLSGEATKGEKEIFP